MHERLVGLVERYALNQLGALRRPDVEDQDGAPVPNILPLSDASRPYVASRLFAEAVLWRKGLPTDAFLAPVGETGDAPSVVDGPGDLGVDGIFLLLSGDSAVGALKRLDALAAALDAEAADDPDAADSGDALLEAEIDAIAAAGARVVIVQVKTGGKNAKAEMAEFTVAAQSWLTSERDDIRKRGPNRAAWAQWRRYEALRTALRRASAPAEIVVDVTFVYAAGALTSPDLAPYLNAARDNLRSAAAKAFAQDGQSTTHRLQIHLDTWDQGVLLNLEAALSRVNYGALSGFRGVATPADGPAPGYIGFAPASALAELIEDGTRQGAIDPLVFAENVRVFLGDDAESNPAADSIRATFDAGRGDAFLFQNNGVTIVAAKVEPSSDLSRIRLTDFQIVNGAQTTTTLFQLRDALGDAAAPVKIIETQDAALLDGVVRGANTQTPVNDYDLLARHPKSLQIEAAFDARAQSAADKIWFQRRRNETPAGVVASDETPMRIVGVKTLIEAFAAILRPPHEISPKPTLEAIRRREIFHDAHSPEAYRFAAWLAAVGRFWAAQSDGGYSWVDDDVSAGSGPPYPARFQFMHALSRLTLGLGSSPPEDLSAFEPFRAGCAQLGAVGKARALGDRAARAVLAAASLGEARGRWRADKSLRGARGRDAAYEAWAQQASRAKLVDKIRRAEGFRDLRLDSEAARTLSFSIRLSVVLDLLAKDPRV